MGSGRKGMDSRQPIGDDFTAAGASAREKYERGREEHLRKLAWWRPWLNTAAAGALVVAVLCAVFYGPLLGAGIALAAVALLLSAIAL
ncbi:MAG: hypothetical protein ABSB75_05270, partial [Candidatus Limnocylindrales bacterium]